MDALHQMLVLSVVVFTSIAAVIDCRLHKIPNWLTVSAFLLALVFQIAVHGLTGLAGALLGALTGFGILFVLWLIGGGGGGDVKLMAAVGAWLGSKYTLYVFVLSTGFAIVLTLVLIAARAVVTASRSADAGEQQLSAPEQHGKTRGGWSIPYALPVAASCWTVLIIQAMLHGIS